VGRDASRGIAALLLVFTVQSSAKAESAPNDTGSAAPSIAASRTPRVFLASTPPDAPVGEGEWWTEDDWEWVDHAPAVPGSQEKSPWKSVGASALLPGLGQQYVGRSKRAGFFYAVEAAIWTAFAVYRIQGEERRDRMVEFAGVHAGAPEGGEDDYYEHIGLWSSLEQWHDIVRRDARAFFPEDPAAQADYFERNKRYDEAEAWAWPDDETRLRYRVLRSKSEGAFRNSRHAVGGAILNRFASVIDALALTRRHNHALREKGLSFDLRIEAKDTASGLVIGPNLTAWY
jgi:hypothetical protein